MAAVRGPCGTCRRARVIRRDGNCFPCGCPEDRRQLIEHGVPYMSASQLAGMVKKGRAQHKTAGQIHALLAFVHPILMENVLITEGGVLALRSKEQVWIRRGRWEVGEVDRDW